MMPAFARLVLRDHAFSRILEWARLALITTAGQAVVQGSGFISGIIIIRLLSTGEYALYTLANTFLGTMTMLADSGISSGVLAEGGKVWQNKRQLGVVLATGLHLRQRFGLLTLVFMIPVMVYFLSVHGAGTWTTVLIVTAVIPAFFAALSDSILEMPPRLHQDIRPLQRNQAEVSAGRLLLSALFLSAFPFTFLAVLASSLPRIYGNYRLRRIAAPFAAAGARPDPQVKKEVVKGVSRTLPIVIYHCISGQIAIWLVSILGTTANISELGALGRIAIIFNMVTVLFSTLVIPRFSRMEGRRRALLRSYIVTQCAMLLVSLALMSGVWLFTDQILWILGGNYTGLSTELLLMGLLSCAGLLSGVCSQLVISRGWFIRPHYLIGINFTSTVLSLTLFHIRTLNDILCFNIIVTAISYFLVLGYGLLSISRTPETLAAPEADPIS